MKYLLFLNRFEQDKNITIKKIENLGAKLIKREEKNLVIESENIEELLKFQEISKILKLTTDWKELNFNTLKKDSLEAVKNLKERTYQIQTKFHDKIKISAKSVYKHINPYLKHEGYLPKEENSEIILYIEFKKDKNKIVYRISYSLESWYKLLKAIMIDYSKFIVVLENPALVEEISDFLRLCWIFKIPLYIITKDKNFDRLLKKAKEITKGIDYEKMDLKIANNLPENYILVGFSKLARQNEKELKIFLEKENKKIALIFGDDKFGLSSEIRDKMNCMFRLTPEIKKPLRASHALSYVLGLYTSMKL